MKKAFVTFLTLFVPLVLAITTSEPESPAIVTSEPEPPAMGYSCEKVNNLFISCVEYFIGEVGSGPSVGCCNSLGEVKSSAPTTDERSAACKCFHEVAIRLPNLSENNVASLPKLCGVDAGFILSTSTDCNNVPIS